MKYTYKKGEKLKSRKLIEQLFSKGKRFRSFPIQLVYLQVEHKSEYLIQSGFTVSKRHFKHAVDRNRIKRLMREAYRLQKHSIFEKTDKIYTKKYIFMFIYMSNEKLAYQEVAIHIKRLLDQFTKKINS
jgi:ribonuclease P protein component